MSDARDHGGGLDVAISKYGGTREQWLDLSTGILVVFIFFQDDCYLLSLTS